jgi:hypothetical protein
MAYQDDLELQNQSKAGTGGVIAGSGGAASPTPGAQPAGSGFTNLQTYLSANKGQGGQLADSIVSEGQKGVDTARNAADKTADAWADGVVQDANSGAADTNADYSGPADASKAAGLNDLEKNYQNVREGANNYAGDYQSQKAGLMKANNYGVGFGALDTFLGRQDGASKIADWQKNVDTGSTAGALQKANTGIQGAQTDLKFRQAQAIANQTGPGGAPDYGSGQMMPAQVIPQAPAPTPIATTGVSSSWDGLKDLLSEINGMPTPAPAAPKPAAKPAPKPGSGGGGFNSRQRRY